MSYTDYDEFNTSHDVNTALRKRLDAIDNNATFSTSGTVPGYKVDPGLRVEGIGHLPMPLSKENVRRLIALSRQAPFGKGTETIVDTTVRNTWEIDASQVQLKGKNWRFNELQALDEVCEQLGVAGGALNVQAQLYKLLIYEKGAMFKAHQDTEKAEGMFGTMVISLQCEHKGGDVVVSLNGESKTLSTASCSKYGCNYLAWYSDVYHEVQPVTSGYRVVLTYNLVYDGLTCAPRPADSTSNHYQALRNTLRGWSRSFNMGDESPKRLLYILDHGYTEAGLRLDRLKGKDQLRVQAVVSLLEDTHFDCYLATVEKKVHGAAEPGDPFEEEQYRDSDEESEEGSEDDFHLISDVIDEEVKITHLAYLDGEPADVDAEGLDEDVDEYEDIVQDDVFSGQEPDEHEYEGYMGNWGCTATHWYRFAFLVLKPREVAWSDDEEDFEELQEVVEIQDEEEVPVVQPPTTGTKRKAIEDVENLPPQKRVAVIDLCESP